VPRHGRVGLMQSVAPHLLRDAADGNHELIAIDPDSAQLAAEPAASGHDNGGCRHQDRSLAHHGKAKRDRPCVYLCFF
jgi:hypothetical protein